MALDKTVEAFLKNTFKDSVKFDFPMAEKTTFKVGGTAAAFVTPESDQDLKTLMEFVKLNKVKCFILGGGSNIVFCDGTYQGIVISLSSFNKIQTLSSEQDTAVQDTALVKCGAGATVASLVTYCTKNSVSGLQEFAGLPGSVGGAVFMNARCFGKEFSQVLHSAEYLDLKDNQIHTYKMDSTHWDYKKSFFNPETQEQPSSQKIVLNCTFKLTQKENFQEQLQKECKVFIQERKSKGHFEYPSAGSVFKNNHEFGKPSGAIIDQCGLKGFAEGGARVAPFHGNIIINTGSATAANIKTLVEKVKEIVKEKTGFALEPEIIFVE